MADVKLSDLAKYGGRYDPAQGRMVPNTPEQAKAAEARLDRQKDD